MLHVLTCVSVLEVGGVYPKEGCTEHRQLVILGYPNRSLLLILSCKGYSICESGFFKKQKQERNYACKEFTGGYTTEKWGGSWKSLGNDDSTKMCGPVKKRGKARGWTVRDCSTALGVLGETEKSSGRVKVFHFVSPVSASNEPALVSLVSCLVIGCE